MNEENMTGLWIEFFFFSISNQYPVYFDRLFFSSVENKISFWIRKLLH